MVLRKEAANMEKAIRVLQELRALGAAVRFKPLFMSDLLELVEGLLSPGARSQA